MKIEDTDYGYIFLVPSVNGNAPFIGELFQKYPETQTVTVRDIFTTQDLIDVPYGTEVT